MKRSLVVLGLGCACLLRPADKDKDIAGMPEGPGKAQLAAVCLECHGVANIRRQRLSRDEWTTEVSDMIDRGAKANEEQIGAILDYLSANFGKDSKLRVNTAPMVEFKAVLDLTAKEAEAIVAYRDANGGFHQVSDLLKVPGVDSGKIEAKKDLLEF